MLPSSGGNTTVSSGGNTTISGGGATIVDGSIVTLGGSGCSPLARIGDVATVNPVTDMATIVTGSPRVTAC